MNVKNVKLFLDTCGIAGRMDQLLPPLPQGITPRYVRVIEQIALLSRQNRVVRVSDISEVLEVTRPGITAVLRELAEMGYVTKVRNDQDSRVVYVSLTEKGEELYRVYVLEYHAHLAEVLSEIGDEGVETFASVIRRAMSLISQDNDNQNAQAFRK